MTFLPIIYYNTILKHIIMLHSGESKHCSCSSKTKKDYSKKMGVNVLDFKAGDIVLQRNMVKARTIGLFTVVFVCLHIYE